MDNKILSISFESLLDPDRHLAHPLKLVNSVQRWEVTIKWVDFDYHTDDDYKNYDYDTDEDCIISEYVIRFTTWYHRDLNVNSHVMNDDDYKIILQQFKDCIVNTINTCSQRDIEGFFSGTKDVDYTSTVIESPLLVGRDERVNCESLAFFNFLDVAIPELSTNVNLRDYKAMQAIASAEYIYYSNCKLVVGLYDYTLGRLYSPPFKTFEEVYNWSIT